MAVLASTVTALWHAVSHLRMDTHSAPVAGVLSAVGFLTVVGAMVAAAQRIRQGRDAGEAERRRAA